MISNRKTGAKKIYSYYRCNKSLCDRLCSFTKRISQKQVESYLLNNLESEYERNLLDYTVAEKTAGSRSRERSLESYLKEQERLNLLFQKERISWEYYDSEYAKIQDKIKSLRPPEKRSKKNMGYIKELLNSDFKEMYCKLSEENRQSFWQNIVREIHLKEDSSIDFIEFY